MGNEKRNRFDLSEELQEKSKNVGSLCLGAEDTVKELSNALNDLFLYEDDKQQLQRSLRQLLNEFYVAAFYDGKEN